MKTFNLPESHREFTDKYFLRTNEIFKAENINPWVLGQVMIRKGPGKVFGIEETIAILEKYSSVREHGGEIRAVAEGSNYNPRDTIMHILAPIQDIVELETMYLGVLSAETTKQNDSHGVNLDEVTRRMSEVVRASGNRPVIYMGARHWRYDEDAAIAKAAFLGGASDTSTDVGAATVGKIGVGTIPHVLENTLAYFYGKENAVKMAAVMFDRHIDPSVKRIPLIDYRNKEITDTLATAEALNGRMYAFRQDTCGENVSEGAIKEVDYNKLAELVGKRIVIPTEDEKFWFGTGVTVTGTYAIRKALAENGFKDVKTVLSSGFAEPEKVRAFSRAEEILGQKLYDILGVGQVFESRAAKMDIVAVGEDAEHMTYISKAGRGFKDNENMRIVYGG